MAQRLYTTAGSEILFSKQDADLGQYIWYQHEFGYAYCRPTRSSKNGKYRRLMWFHREVAKRLRGTDKAPRRVGFKNKNRLDCRRSNLVLTD